VTAINLYGEAMSSGKKKETPTTVSADAMFDMLGVKNGSPSG